MNYRKIINTDCLPFTVDQTEESPDSHTAILSSATASRYSVNNGGSSTISFTVSFAYADTIEVRFLKDGAAYPFSDDWNVNTTKRIYQWDDFYGQESMMYSSEEVTKQLSAYTILNTTPLGSYVFEIKATNRFNLPMTKTVAVEVTEPEAITYRTISTVYNQSSYSNYWMPDTCPSYPEMATQDTSSSRTLQSSGCGIFTIAHAIEWLTGEVPDIATLRDYCGNTANYSSGMCGSAMTYIDSVYGIEYEDATATDKYLKGVFDKGGIVVSATSDGAHYFLAVEYLEYNGESYVHIIDSSTGSTLTRGYRGYWLDSMEPINSYRDICTSGDYGEGHEYWITMSQLRSKVLLALTKTGTAHPAVEPGKAVFSNYLVNEKVNLSDLGTNLTIKRSSASNATEYLVSAKVLEGEPNGEENVTIQHALNRTMEIEIEKKSLARPITVITTAFDRADLSFSPDFPRSRLHIEELQGESDQALLSRSCPPGTEAVILCIYDETLRERCRGLLLDTGLMDTEIMNFYDYARHGLPVIKLNRIMCMKEKCYTGMILGTSLSEVGVLSEGLPGDWCNLAASAQDLYYNYKTLEYIFHHYPERFCSLKHVILELYDYFYLNYDISRSPLMLEKYILWGGYSSDPHNYEKNSRHSHSFEEILEIVNSHYEGLVTSKGLALWSELFEGYHERTGYKMYKDSFGIDKRRSDILSDPGITFNDGIYYSVIRNEDTIPEYRQILHDTLKLIREFAPGAAVHAILMPKYIETEKKEGPYLAELKKLFYQVIAEEQALFPFSFHDLKSDEISSCPEYYLDNYHLNYRGAVCFTDMLHKILKQKE